MAVDLFHTDTTAYADIVLPAASFLECDDLVLSHFDLTVSAQVKAGDPPGTALPNSEIFRRLAAAMGFAEPELFETDPTSSRGSSPRRPLKAPSPTWPPWVRPPSSPSRRCSSKASPSVRRRDELSLRAGRQPPSACRACPWPTSTRRPRMAGCASSPPRLPVADELELRQ
ncbi:molybdopterin-dependent oxidoreductase [Xanthobacter aminoxidans]|uniref:molybdopterin-dependent oxidoreductase n=1 Tax=Xanthobacter aminoxidans TaxID=186280 RepID=UPI0037295B39